MIQDTSKIIDKIRALMAKTLENGCTQAEAEAAAQKVAALMAVYQLNEADVMPKDQKNKRGEATCKYGKVEPWTLSLSIVVARMTGTYSAYSSYGGKVYFYGTEDAVDAAVYTFNNLQEQIAKMAYAYWKQVKADTPDYLKGQTIRDYRTGAVSGIQNAVQEQQEAQRFSEQNTTALIVINNSIEKAKEWATGETKFRNGRARTESRVRSSTAYYQGYEDGGSIQRQKRLGGK